MVPSHLCKSVGAVSAKLFVFAHYVLVWSSEIIWKARYEITRVSRLILDSCLDWIEKEALSC